MNRLITIFRESRLARFLIPAGIILLVFGIIFFNANNQNKDFVQTEATVTKVELEQEAYTDANGNREEASYKVDVKYTVNGKDYTSDLSGVSKYSVGDKIKIYYNPADPSQITMTKSLIIPVIMAVVGLAALVGGIFSAINAVKRISKMKAQEEAWK